MPATATIEQTARSGKTLEIYVCNRSIGARVEGRETEYMKCPLNWRGEKVVNQVSALFHRYLSFLFFFFGAVDNSKEICAGFPSLAKQAARFFLPSLPSFLPSFLLSASFCHARRILTAGRSRCYRYVFTFFFPYFFPVTVALPVDVAIPGRKSHPRK